MLMQRMCLAGCLCLALCGTAFGEQASRKQLGRAGEWRGTLAGAVLNDWIYTAEENGGLYRTNPYTGQWTQVGGLDFGNTRFMFAIGPWLYTIESDGSLYRVSAGNGAWQQLGEAGGWLNTIAGVAWPADVQGGALLTVESNGGLYSTRPANGSWTQIGQPDFNNTRFMFAVGPWLYTIEADGSLYQVDPVQAGWRRIGSPGGWSGTFAGTALNNRIYTVEASGSLFETDPATGEWRQIGATEYGNTAFMFATGGGLVVIETDGSLYRITPPAAGSTAPDALPQAAGSRVESRTTMNVTPQGDNRFRADVSYVDKQGRPQAKSMDGSRDDIQVWLRTLPLPADALNNFLRAMDQAGRPRLPPGRR